MTTTSGSRDSPHEVALGAGRRVPYPTPTSAAASHIGRGNVRADTKPEVALCSELHRSGLRFRKDHPIDVGGRSVRVDVALTRLRLAVMVDGCFWHACPQHGSTPRSNQAYWVPKLARNVERDRRNDADLDAAGWTVVRVWEHEPPGEAASRIAAVADALRRPGTR